MQDTAQKQMYQFIKDFMERHGYPPTVREIGEGVGLRSTAAVSARLKAMKRDGLLTADGSKPRTAVIAGARYVFPEPPRDAGAPEAFPEGGGREGGPR